MSSFADAISASSDGRATAALSGELPPVWEADRVADGGETAQPALSAAAAAVNARAESYPNQSVDPEGVGLLKQPGAPATRKIRWYTKLAYAMPELSKVSVTMLMNVHALAFYNEYGANLSILSFLIALARSFDVLTDPLMGWLTDSTRSRFGRRRVYMIACAPFYGAALIALLSAGPAFASEENADRREAGIVAWFGIFYPLLYLCDTGANVPHSALGPEMTDTQNQRNSLFFYSGIFKMLGILIAAIMPVAVQYKLTQDWGCYEQTALEQKSWPPCTLLAKGMGLQYTALFLALWYVAAVYWCCLMVRERPASVSTATPPLVPSLMATRRNAPFMVLLPTWVLDQLSVTLVATMITYFYTYVVQPEMTTECDARCTLDDAGAAWYASLPELDERGRSFKSDAFPGCRSDFWCGTSGWIGLSIVVLILGAVIAQPFWLLATHYIEKRTVWLVYNVLNAVTNLLFVAVNQGDPVLCVIVVFINGIPLGAQFLTDSIVADVIDYDELLTGVRSEGRFTIGQSLLPKIVSVPAATVPFTILVLLGFVPPDAHGEPQPQRTVVVTFIRVVFFGLPFACCVLSSILKLRFPIKSEFIRKAIREGCALHMQGLPAVDPLTNRVVQPIELLPHEQVEQWRLDHFFLKQLEELYMRGPKPLVRRMRKMRANAVLSLVSSVTLCIIGLGQGWMKQQNLAWITTFTAISGGLSLCWLLLAHARLHAALDLQARPVTKAFLARLIALYRGEHHVTNVAGITVEHVSNAFGRWKLTHLAKHHSVTMPAGEEVPLDELMGLLQSVICELDLPVVDASTGGDGDESLTADNAVIAKRALAKFGESRGESRSIPLLEAMASDAAPGDEAASGGGSNGHNAWQRLMSNASTLPEEEAPAQLLPPPAVELAHLAKPTPTLLLVPAPSTPSFLPTLAPPPSTLPSLPAPIPAQADDEIGEIVENDPFGSAEGVGGDRHNPFMSAGGAGEDLSNPFGVSDTVTRI